MSLKDRLRRLTGEEELPSEKPALTERERTLTDLRSRLEAILSRRPQPASKLPHRSPSRRQAAALHDLLPGCEETTPLGSFFRIDSLLEGNDSHGNRQFEELAALDMDAVALLSNDPRLSDFDGRTALFLDTETTGLSGGTGTLAFLIGIGWFNDDGRFVVRQLFARNFSEEQAVLAALQEIAASKRYLVTFNGKSFDLNLLTTRYILNRLDNPLTGLPHLDLLHPARRLYSHRFSNTRLVTLEENLLGFYRDDDLPGSEVPLRYFNWLRSNDPYPMLDVFRHNRLDITALAALTVHLAGMFGADGCSTASYAPTDLCALGRLFLDRGLHTRACSLFENLSGSPSRAASLEARQTLSLIHKRNHHFGRAVDLWEELLRENPKNLFAAEELAKWHEHRNRDVEQAFRLVDAVLNALPEMPEKEKAAWLHRHSRLSARRGKD